MKFRALMQDPEYMREFNLIILTLSKLAKEFVMNITADKVHLIANEESGSLAPLVWIEIDTKLYFSEYTMEGICDDQKPRIILNLSSANMGRALAALRGNPNHCKIKLTNIQFPCLTIEVDAKMPNSEKSRKVVHDVPVDVIPRSEWAHFAVPTTPTCKFVMNVPSNRLMRGLIDKIKNLSPNLIFYGVTTGEMNLVAETETATITTCYKNLEVRSLNLSEEDKSKEYIEASCSVDCKKTALFFAALQVPTLLLSCGIDDDNLLHLEVDVRQGVSIHCILPAVCV